MVAIRTMQFWDLVHYFVVLLLINVTGTFISTVIVQY